MTLSKLISNKKFIILLTICLLFLTSRLYRINSIPPSVYWDEASIGYNAFAISTDLKDEWGEFLPLHFRAFGEFKLPVYIYAVSFLVKLFGLSTWAVRLPAVLFTLGTILTVYFLVKEITKDTQAGLLSAFILSVSPWLFIFSRTGYEATAGLFFFLLLVYFLLLYRKNTIYVLPAVLSAVASFYSYNSFRIIIPVFLFIWGLYFIKEKLFKRKRVILELAAVFVFAVSLIPTIKLFYFDWGGARLTTVVVKEPKALLSNYLSHFSPSFLFMEGDANERHQVEGWGQLYWIDLPLILFGLYFIVQSKNKLLWMFPLTLLIAPIPASIAREAPHALRAILMAPVFAALVGLGASKLKNWLIASTVVVYLIVFSLYFTNFVNAYPKDKASWMREYKEWIETNEKEIDSARKVTITDKYAQPYIFVLYYYRISPSEFRSSAQYNPPDKWGFSTVSKFGKFEFRNIESGIEIEK